MKKLIVLLKITYKKIYPIISNKWVGYFLCLFGFILVVTAFSPGYMSPDSTDNWIQSRQGVFRDINAPFMAYFWGLTEKLIPGPKIMFLLQNIIFWSGLLIFWWLARRKSKVLGFCIVIIGFMPQIMSQLSTVWKDVGLGASLILVSALIYYSSQTKNNLVLLLTPVFLFYGYAVRLNSAPAILPIVIWSIFVLFRNLRIVDKATKKTKVFIPIFVSLIYFALLTGTVYFVNKTITKGKTTYPYQQIFIYDLAAISKARNKVLFPDYATKSENFSLKNVAKEYNLRSVNNLIYGDKPKDGDKPIILLTYNSKEIEQLKGYWLKTVKENPSIYLKHKWNVFAQLIGFTRNTVSNPYWDLGFDTNPPEFRAEPNSLNTILMEYFFRLRKFFFFRGYFWLLLTFYFLYRSIKARLKDDWEIVFYLSLSSILFAFAYFPTTPSTEFRYLFWTAIASAIVTVFGSFLILKSRNVNK